MIFYTALDERGHKQLRATQADAKAVNRVFEQIDIPTDKTGLREFVQQLYARADELSDQIVEGGEELPASDWPPPNTAHVQPPIIDWRDPGDPLPDDDSALDPVRLEEQVIALGNAGPAGLDLVANALDRMGVGAAFARGVSLLNVLASDEHQLAAVFLRERRKKQRRFG
jgi:hypothetical protein